MRRMINQKATIKDYNVTINVSCRKWIIMYEKDIEKIKEIFSKKKEVAKDLADEWNYVKYIHLLEWAIECHATSVKMKNSLTEQCIEFKFLFNKFEDMIKFINNLDFNVNEKYINYMNETN